MDPKSDPFYDRKVTFYREFQSLVTHLLDHINTQVQECLVVPFRAESTSSKPQSNTTTPTTSYYQKPVNKQELQLKQFMSRIRREQTNAKKKVNTLLYELFHPGFEVPPPKEDYLEPKGTEGTNTSTQVPSQIGSDDDEGSESLKAPNPSKGPNPSKEPEDEDDDDGYDGYDDMIDCIELDSSNDDDAGEHQHEQLVSSRQSQESHQIQGSQQPDGSQHPQGSQQAQSQQTQKKRKPRTKRTLQPDGTEEPRPKPKRIRKPAKPKPQIPKPRYSCSWPACGQIFSSYKNQSAHQLTHDPEYPNHCRFEGCDQKFAQRYNARNHYLTHVTEKPYECTWPDCGKSFSVASLLKYHEYTHTNAERPHVCPYEQCNYSHLDKCRLEEHIRLHTGEKPFECSWPGCELTFRVKRHFDRHFLTHTGEKKHACWFEGCEMKFSRRDKVVDHYRRVHEGRYRKNK